MITYACECGEGMGLAHSHYEEAAFCRDRVSGATFHLQKSIVDMNPHLNETIEILDWNPPGIKIWINWRELAEAFMRDFSG
jgi:hypothetical protein